ncbi:hypothetical protein FQN51_009236 [Onygenales sp. PD_10]|nr:hypothetical protein FQN51_009236 [Onygenales sp. PD_10]
MPVNNTRTYDSRSMATESTLPTDEGGLSTLSAASSPHRQGFTEMQSQAIERPTPRAQLENPREFQINQIRRRFHPKEKLDGNGAHLTFEMVPSDPDFNFHPKILACALHVPLDYPKQGKPSLEIVNENIEERYKNLIQQEFKNVARTRASDTLLTWMNILDRSLTSIFTTLHSGMQFGLEKSTVPSPTPPTPVLGASMAQEMEKAKQRREKEITQLTSRLGRTPLFSKASDGISFTIPISPLKPQLLPHSLRSVRTINLVVPALYPLEPCQVKLPGVDDNAAKNAESSFEKHVIENSTASLMSHINYLSSMMHILVTQSAKRSDTSSAVTSLPIEDKPKDDIGQPSRPSAPLELSPPMETQTSTTLEDRPHIQIIPRPPEWMNPNTDDEFDSDESDYSASEGSVTDEDDDEGGGVSVPVMPPPPAGRVVGLSFPSMELLGIELLELKNLHLTLKCERCKELLDLKIKIGEDGISIPPKRIESCKKCGNYLSIGFRREFMHPSSSRAGYLDLEGCLAVELLPRCHDAATDHPNEHANRMICGFCSREQTYRPESCGICHSTLVGKAGSGFWEGGKGTRDKAKMNRKDPRKYKRRGATAPGSSARKK